MARVTVEDCLAQIPNRFALTVLASRRARALGESRGHALVECSNREGVTALREVSAGRVRFREDVESLMTDFIEEQRRQLRVTTGEHTFLEAVSLRALEDDEEDEGDVVAEAEVEELQTDPEALNLQANKGESSSDDDSSDSDGAAATTEGDDAPAAADSEVDSDAFGDDDPPEDESASGAATDSESESESATEPEAE